ncbi:MAG: hypothetical protein Ct9H300mP6_13730 [Gammaproteobacteria bacterium]|nr:MAG: hypothetical protein Ct9H300mP6_13730 [Gammaproteobacteria bacterium]
MRNIFIFGLIFIFVLFLMLYSQLMRGSTL